MAISDLTFPPGFLWGTATAAHQVEGANDNNDWWDWEQTNSHIKNGDKSTVACDWWKGERYREDFDRAKALHQNAHRLSVEWSRIEPREGEWSADAFAFYRRVLSALRERGITPLVTLHHYTNPRWFARKRGWETQDAIPLFERYATRVVQELGDLCDFWITINEPFIYVYSSYNDAAWPPGKKDFFLAFRVLANLVRGHAAVFHAIHRIQRDARVGVAHHLRRFIPLRTALDGWAANLRDRMLNRLFFLALVDGKLRFPMSVGEKIPEAIDTQDFIGINYYFGERTAFDVTKPMLLFTRSILPEWSPGALPQAGDVHPRGLYEFLLELSSYRKPIYITENGIFDLRDETQPRYLISHLREVHRAIADGASVRGYFWWSLVDNFEWAEGYSPHFGLFANDLETQTRIPRVTAEIYARVAQENTVAHDWIERYGAEGIKRNS